MVANANTPEELREATEAMKRCGSLAAAARDLGLPRTTLQSRLKAAARLGHAPGHWNDGVAPGYHMGKVTVQRGADGVVERVWERQHPDETSKLRQIEDWAAGLADGVKGMSAWVPAPLKGPDDMLNVIPMGDPHLGLLAWKDEAGEDYDLERGKNLIMAAVDRLVDAAPPAKTALVLSMGDLVHSDNRSNRTERSGHPLDSERWGKCMIVGRDVLVYSIYRALERHENVVVKCVLGNHDWHSSFAISLILDGFFTNNPRVKVDVSAASHWYYRFGKTLFGVTHGDTSKMQDLPLLMAADRPEDWGQTKYRVWYQGHIHHVDRKEYQGVIVEAVRTLAAKDAWHAGQGYRAGRDMQLISYHAEDGEVERHRCDIASIAA